MNSTLCISADTVFDKLLAQNEIAATEHSYATELIPAIRRPVFQQPDEEELHTSFEEAISDRLLAMQSRLSRLSDPMLTVKCAERNTDAVFSAGVSTSNTTAAREFVHATSATDRVKFLSRPAVALRRAIVFACSAMMFMLLGFDSLGLLMLHVH